MPDVGPNKIEFMKENLTSSGEYSPMAILMLSVMDAFAKFERTLIRERQRWVSLLLNKEEFTAFASILYLKSRLRPYVSKLIGDAKI